MRRRTMRILIGLALLLSAAALALSVVTVLDEDDPQWREVKLGLTEKEDEFKFSDVAPRARVEEDISAGDSFVFSGDVSGEREGRLAGACDVADKGEPTCHATYTFDESRPPVCLTSASRPRRSCSRLPVDQAPTMAPAARSECRRTVRPGTT
jgi:hypothetical protein